MSTGRAGILLAAIALVGCSADDRAPPADAGDDAMVEDVHPRPPPSEDACAAPPEHPAPADAGSPCLSHVPGMGYSCPVDGVACEYGDLPGPLCDAIYTCVLATWKLTSPGDCPATVTCPGTRGEVPVGSLCPNNVVCAYPDDVCTCADIADASGFTWTCAPQTPGCPAPMPKLGSTCPTVGVRCDYGFRRGGVALECGKDGLWARTTCMP